MKVHFIFLPLIFFTLIQQFHSEDFFNYAELKFNSKISIPKKDSDSKKELKEAAGIKLSFKNADFRFYDTLSKTEFDSIPIEIPKKNFESPRYGAGLFLFKETFPVSIKIGKNSYSKSLSKIKNPTPSSFANPLSKSFAFSSGLGATLPTITSTAQTNSLNFAVSLFKKTKFPFYFDTFIDEEKNFAFSVFSIINLSKLTSVQISFTGAKFFLENDSSVLKKNHFDFEPNFYHSALSEISFRSPSFKSNFYLGIQESPYEKNPIWFKIDGRKTFGNFLVDFSYFAIPTSKDSPKVAPIIGANSQIQHTIEQFGINPQVIFLFDDKNSSSLRFGIHGIESWKITNSNKAELLNVGKIRSAVEFENKLFNIRYDFTIANILFSGNPPNKSTTPEKYFSHSISTDFRGKYIFSTINFDFKYFPPYNSNYEKKYDFGTTIYFTPTFFKSISLKNEINAVFTESERKSLKITSSLSHKFKSRKINSSIFCAIDLNYW